MSYAPSDLYGVCGMMPAFSTADAGSLTATNTVDVGNLQNGVDRAIKDGMHMIATTGTFGQCYNLFFDEFQTLVRATLEAVDKRTPLMLGVTSANPRETYQKVKFVREAGGEGVLMGLPYYDPLPIREIPTFYRNMAELFPDISFMVYHNPLNHRVHIPVRAFEELVKIPNVVCMKDSHRAPAELIALHRIIHGKIAHLVQETQLYPYYEMGASGCWSIFAWQGPWPILALYDAVVEGDNKRAQDIIADLGGGGPREIPADPERGYAPHHFAGYVKDGAPRPPFSFGIQDPEAEARVAARTRATAARWVALCEKYRPQVEARRAVHA